MAERPEVAAAAAAAAAEQGEGGGGGRVRLPISRHAAAAIRRTLDGRARRWGEPAPSQPIGECVRHAISLVRRAVERGNNGGVAMPTAKGTVDGKITMAEALKWATACFGARGKIC